MKHPGSPERDDWLDEIVSLTEAASLRKLSIDTLRAEIRAGRLRDIHLSERRRGMTRREALRGSRDGGQRVPKTQPTGNAALMARIAELEARVAELESKVS